LRDFIVADLAAQKENSVQRIDVRSASEFAAGHIPSAINIPMEEVGSRLNDISPSMPLVLICKSGARAGIVASFLRQCRADVSVLEGGTTAWAKEGLPMVVSAKTRWSLERQVRLIAGLIVAVGAVLAVTVNPNWVYLSGFIGIGLTFAGLSDICPMGILLGNMPWNAARECKTPNPVISDAAGDVRFDSLQRILFGGAKQ